MKKLTIMQWAGILFGLAIAIHVVNDLLGYA